MVSIVSGDVGGRSPESKGELLGPALLNLQSWTAKLLSSTMVMEAPAKGLAQVVGKLGSVEFVGGFLGLSSWVYFSVPQMCC